jgi:hypothetical protein
MTHTCWNRIGVMLLAVTGAMVSGARAQLTTEQVLVVYDSRIADSLLVAEHYAGSLAVPGGIGGQAGTRRGVRVVNLATLGAPAANTPTLSQADFRTRLRTPLRDYLNINDPRGHIRCLVLTKGLTHRVDDFNIPGLGDDPLTTGTQLEGGDANFASVDSELALLQQDLSIGPAASTEGGRAGDSYSDGLILNPYHGQTQPINAWSARNRRVVRNFEQVGNGLGPGILWRSLTTPSTQILTPGDIYLVCRLDGNTVADVRAMLDRSAGFRTMLDVNTQRAVIDDSRSDGVANSAPNGEIDNNAIQDQIGNRYGYLGDDYELTRNLLQTDGRVSPANIVYDANNATSNYLVGPRINFGFGIVVTGQLFLLASDGANSGGAPVGAAGRNLAASFNFGPLATVTTIESYNGRALNGLTTLFDQGQAGDAIAAGASLAIGNVWEPFAFSIPDNLVITRNMYLGNSTWAEAAWASLPTISWQQVVIGDPLARVSRTSEDRNGNGVITADDLYTWEATPADINRSNTADNADRRLVETAVRGFEAVDMGMRQRR